MATSVMQLHSNWMKFFSRPDYDGIPNDVKNRLHVLLAITLVHELVHVWYDYRKLEYARQGKISRWIALSKASQDGGAGGAHGSEPYFFGDEEHAELGHAWERYAFDGQDSLGDWRRGSCFSQSSLSMLIPYEREGGAKEPVAARVIDPCLVWAFLSKECWDLYDKVEADSNQYEHVETLELFDKMEKVVALRMFTEGVGRVPSPAELGQQLVDNNLIVRRDLEDILLESAMRTWSPPTPPPTPPTEHSKPNMAAGRKIRTDILVYSRGKIVNAITDDS